MCDFVDTQKSIKKTKKKKMLQTINKIIKENKYSSKNFWAINIKNINNTSKSSIINKTLIKEKVIDHKLPGKYLNQI